MTLFSLDTSTRTGSMAVWIDGQTHETVITDSRSHAERQPSEAMHWLKELGLTFGDIDTFVVLAGPGSFTGLRVGLAAVQGWAVSTGRPLAAVPTLAAVVAAGPELSPDQVVVPCLDGQRGEVFYGAVVGGRWLIEPAVAKPSDVIAAVSMHAPGVGVVALGDGAERYQDQFAQAGWQCTPFVKSLAEAAVRLVAAGHYAPGTPHAVRLQYVRRTDAEVNRERQRGQTA